MKFVVTGGGTAGHVNPAIAVAGALRNLGHDCLYAGSPDSFESRLAPKAGFEFKAFEAAGFDRSKKKTLITSTLKLLKSTRAAKAWLGAEKPDAVIGFGGYVSVPVGRAATKLGIPLLIHEQNSVLGMTNRYLASHASHVALTYDCARKGLKTAAPITVTGNPVRESLFGFTRESAREAIGIPKDARFLFVFGGSQGARHINTAITSAARGLLEREDLVILHVTGPKQYDAVVAQLEEQGVAYGESERYRIEPYFYEMGEALTGCDVVVARAGATSIAEITALGAVAIYVPFPYATDDHQTTNAQAAVDAGAALFCPDEEVENAQFREQIAMLLDSPELRDTMSRASSELGKRDAAQSLAQLAISLAESRAR